MPFFAIPKFTVLLEPLWVPADFLLLSTGPLLYLILFGALISVVSECSSAVCGNLCGQKRFPPSFR